MKKAKTYTIRPAATKARKLASLGFGSKNTCRGYLESSSLSPLNDKFFFALFALVFSEHYARFNFASDGNRLTAKVARATVNGYTATVALDFELINRKADLLEQEYRDTLAGLELEAALAKLPRFNHTTASVIVSYRRFDKGGEELPARYLGEIKRFEFDGEQYFKDDFKSYTVTITD